MRRSIATVSLSGMLREKLHMRCAYEALAWGSNVDLRTEWRTSREPSRSA